MKKIAIFLALLLINVLLFGRYLFNFVLNGDDLYLLSGAPTSLIEVSNKFTNFTGQYRPLAHLAYNIYKPFQYNFQLVYFIHLLIFTSVQFLFYSVLRLKLNKVVSFIATVATFANPILYYHIFTTAGDINLYIIGLFLGMVLAIAHKRLSIAVALFFISIFVKETFIVAIPLIAYAIWESQIIMKRKILISVILAIALAIYGYFRVTQYNVIDENYSFVFTFAKAKENIGNIVAWIINHPRGWQYNFFGFRNIFNYIQDILAIGLWIGALFFSFKKSKKWSAVLLSSFVLSILPFVFLNRTLVFYIDLPVIILSLLLVDALASKYGKIILVSLVLSTALCYGLYLEKWVNWSFVGNANMIANNFVKTTRNIDVSKYDNVCIYNHTLGVWATENGKLFYLVHPSFKGTVVSINVDSVKDCPKGLILRNDGGDYKLIR